MYIDDVNVDALRDELMDYFGAAMYNGFPAAIIDISNLECASDEEIVKIAIDNGIDISKYAKRR